MSGLARSIGFRVGVWLNCTAVSAWDHAKAECAAQHFHFSAAAESRTPNRCRLDRLSLQLTWRIYYQKKNYELERRYPCCHDSIRCRWRNKPRLDEKTS